MENVLQELTNLGSAGVARALEGYTRWYLVSAIGWLILGIIAVCLGIKIMRQDWKCLDRDDQWVKYCVAGVVILIGSVIVIYNCSTIVAPEAYAIHNLIVDLKP